MTVDVKVGNGTPQKPRYEVVKCLGSGSYAEVSLVADTTTNTYLAMKSQRLEEHEKQDGLPSWVIREASLLRDLNHPNIVKLFEVHNKGHCVDMILELADMNLHSYMKLHGPFSNGNLKQPLLQCVMAIEYCHGRKIVHRDVKPQNILVNTKTQQVKLTDFGLARVLHTPVQPLTQDVVSLWYRAPEIILGNARYGLGVDVWSLGCIAAEMATASPLFPGDSQISQLFKIFRILGTPTEKSWPGVTKLSHYHYAFPLWHNTDFCGLRQRGGDALRNAGFDLLRSILQCDPSKRLSARRLRRHYFFENPMPEIRAISSSISGKFSLSVAKSSPFAGTLPYNQRAFAMQVAAFIDTDSGL